MAPTLPALLCLGEMRWGGGSPGLERPPHPACSIRGPQDPGGSRGREAMLRAEGRTLTGRSLPGLSVGLRTPVQAGESVPGPSSLFSRGQGSLPGHGEGKGSSGFMHVQGLWEVWADGRDLEGRLVSLHLISFQGPSPNPPSGLSRAL